MNNFKYWNNRFIFCLIVLAAVSCGSTNIAENNSDTENIRSKDLQDARVIVLEFKDKVERLELKDKDISLKNSKMDREQYIRFRLCKNERTNIDKCDYLARGKWISKDQVTRFITVKNQQKTEQGNRFLQMGLIYSAIGVAISIMEKKPLYKFPLTPTIFFGYGIGATIYGMHKKYSQDKGNYALSIVINEPDNKLKITKLDTLIEEIELLGVSIN